MRKIILFAVIGVLFSCKTQQIIEQRNIKDDSLYAQVDSMRTAFKSVKTDVKNVLFDLTAYKNSVSTKFTQLQNDVDTKEVTTEYGDSGKVKKQTTRETRQRQNSVIRDSTTANETQNIRYESMQKTIDSLSVVTSKLQAKLLQVSKADASKITAKQPTDIKHIITYCIIGLLVIFVLYVIWKFKILR